MAFKMVVEKVVEEAVEKAVEKAVEIVVEMAVGMAVGMVVRFQSGRFQLASNHFESYPKIDSNRIKGEVVDIDFVLKNKIVV
jgi:predicted TPR repeat methyltransferase